MVSFVSDRTDTQFLRLYLNFELSRIPNRVILGFVRFLDLPATIRRGARFGDVCCDVTKRIHSQKQSQASNIKHPTDSPLQLIQSSVKHYNYNSSDTNSCSIVYWKDDFPLTELTRLIHSKPQASADGNDEIAHEIAHPSDAPRRSPITIENQSTNESTVCFHVSKFGNEATGRD